MPLADQVIRPYAFDIEYGRRYGEDNVDDGAPTKQTPLTAETRVRAGLAEQTFFDSPEYKYGMKENPGLWGQLPELFHSATTNLQYGLNMNDRDLVDKELSSMQEFTKKNRDGLNRMSYVASTYKDERSQQLAKMAESLVTGTWTDGIKNSEGVTLTQYVLHEKPVDKAKRTMGLSDAVATAWADPSNAMYGAFDNIRDLKKSADKYADRGALQPPDGASIVNSDAVVKFASSFGKLLDDDVFSSSAEANMFAGSLINLGFVGGGEDYDAMKAYAHAWKQAKDTIPNFSPAAWDKSMKTLFSSVVPTVTVPDGGDGKVVKTIRDPLVPEALVHASAAELITRYNNDKKVFNPADPKVVRAFEIALSQRAALERAGGYLPNKMNNIVSDSVYARLSGSGTDHLTQMMSVAERFASTLNGAYDKATGGTFFSTDIDKAVFGALLANEYAQTGSNLYSGNELGTLKQKGSVDSSIVDKRVDSIIAQYYGEDKNTKLDAPVPFHSLGVTAAKELFKRVITNSITGEKTESAAAILDDIAQLNDVKQDAYWVDLRRTNETSGGVQRAQNAYAAWVLEQARVDRPTDDNIFNGLDDTKKSDVTAIVHNLTIRNDSSLTKFLDPDKSGTSVVGRLMWDNYDAVIPIDLKAKLTTDDINFIKRGDLVKAITKCDRSSGVSEIPSRQFWPLLDLTEHLVAVYTDESVSEEARADAGQLISDLFPVITNTDLRSAALKAGRNPLDSYQRMATMCSKLGVPWKYKIATDGSKSAGNYTITIDYSDDAAREFYARLVDTTARTRLPGRPSPLEVMGLTFDGATDIGRKQDDPDLLGVINNRLKGLSGAQAIRKEKAADVESSNDTARYQARAYIEGQTKVQALAEDFDGITKKLTAGCYGLPEEDKSFQVAANTMLQRCKDAIKDMNVTDAKRYLKRIKDNTGMYFFRMSSPGKNSGGSAGGAANPVIYAMAFPSKDELYKWWVSKNPADKNKSKEEVLAYIDSTQLPLRTEYAEQQRIRFYNLTRKSTDPSEL